MASVASTPRAHATPRKRADLMLSLDARRPLSRLRLSSNASPCDMSPRHKKKVASPAIIGKKALPSPKLSARKTARAPLLHAAVVAGDEAKVNELIAAGVSVEAADADGRTPLALAAANNRVAVARALIEAHAVVDSSCHEEMAPLSWAAIRGSKACVQLLIDAGAHLNATDKAGRTALMVRAAPGPNHRRP